MFLNEYEQQQALQAAGINKIKESIKGYNNPECVDVHRLAVFLYEQFERGGKISISSLPPMGYVGGQNLSAANKKKG